MLSLIVTLLVGFVGALFLATISYAVVNRYLTHIISVLPDTGSYLLWKNFVNFIINNYYAVIMVLVMGSVLFYLRLREGA